MDPCTGFPHSVSWPAQGQENWRSFEPWPLWQPSCGFFKTLRAPLASGGLPTTVWCVNFPMLPYFKKLLLIMTKPWPFQNGSIRKAIAAITNRVPRPLVVSGIFCGGTLVLVKRQLRHRLAFQAGNDDAQLVSVYISGWLLGSIYAPPRVGSPNAAANLLTECLIATHNVGSHRWCFGGDYNEIPKDSHFLDVASSLGGSLISSGQPTRWEGEREIDFFVGSNPELCSDVEIFSTCVKWSQDTFLVG